MAFPTRKLTGICEITTGQLYDVVLPPAHEGEAGAIEVSVKLEYGGSAASVSGMKPSMYLYDKLRDAMTDSVDMALSGSTITGTMPEAFFAISSRMLLCLVLTDTNSGRTMTVGTLPLEVKNVRGVNLLSVRAPSVSEIVYTGRAPYLSAGNTWMVWDNAAGKYVDSGVSAVGAGTFFAAPRNLLDNSYFVTDWQNKPVDQIGKTYPFEGSAVVSQYLLDRWKIWSTTCAYNLKADGLYVTCNNSSNLGPYQVFPKIADMYGKTYTLMGCYDDDEIACGTVTMPTGLPSEDKYLSAVSTVPGKLGLRIVIEHKSSIAYFQPLVWAGETRKIKWLAMYEGVYTAATRPQYVPRPYSAELAECKRYLQKIRVKSAPWYIESAATQRYYVCLDEEMRIPTYDVDLSGLKFMHSWTEMDVTTSVYEKTAKGFCITVTAPDNTYTSSLYMSGEVIVNANL